MRKSGLSGLERMAPQGNPRSPAGYLGCESKNLITTRARGEREKFIVGEGAKNTAAQERWM